MSLSFYKQVIIIFFLVKQYCRTILTWKPPLVSSLNYYFHGSTVTSGVLTWKLLDYQSFNREHIVVHIWLSVQSFVYGIIGFTALLLSWNLMEKAEMERSRTLNLLFNFFSVVSATTSLIGADTCCLVLYLCVNTSVHKKMPPKLMNFSVVHWD